MSYEIALVDDGTTERVRIEDDETVLDAIRDRAAEVDVEYSCRAGACTTCAGKVIDGRVEQPGATGLEPADVDDGYALLCVSEPVSDCRIEVGVQEDLFELDTSVL